MEKIKKTQSNKITISVLVSDYNSGFSPCEYIRLILPLSNFDVKKFEIKFIDEKYLFLIKTDFLILSRLPISISLSIDALFDYCKKNKTKVIYDIDDNLINLPINHPEISFYSGHYNLIKKCLLLSDQVWVSTSMLKNAFKPFNSKILVATNEFKPNLFNKKNKNINKINEPLKILIMGTKTHDEDFASIYNDLIKLKKTFPTKVSIYVIGMSEIHSTVYWSDLDVPYSVAHSYPRFINWLNEQNFDIGLIPLVDNDFNRCKSSIKFIDYCGLGIVPVVSDIKGPYSDIKNKINGFRVPNKELSWYELLKKVINNPKGLIKIKTSNFKNVFNNKFVKTSKNIRQKNIISLNSTTK